MPGQADVLTREAAADEIGPGHTVIAKLGGTEGADVRVTRHRRPVPGEDGAGERVGLTKCDRLHAGPVQSEAEAADAAEEVKNGRLPVVHAARLLFLG